MFCTNFSSFDGEYGYETISAQTILINDFVSLQKHLE